jgi:hypothetical protein
MEERAVFVVKVEVEPHFSILELLLLDCQVTMGCG